jgi:hypothetical protein
MKIDLDLALNYFIVISMIMLFSLIWFYDANYNSNNTNEGFMYRPLLRSTISKSYIDNLYPKGDANIPYVSGVRLISKHKPVIIEPSSNPMSSAQNLVDDNAYTAWASNRGSLHKITIDLLKPMDITRVIITNRKDCCKNEFRLYELIVDDEYIEQRDANGKTSTQHLFHPYVQGQYVSLQFSYPITLADIKVYGRESI